MLARLVENYPDTVKIVYRHYPLTSIHALAQKAAEAAEAAGAQGKFWPYHDRLFETQRDWSSLSAEDGNAFFIDLASELELDVAQFTAELNGDVYAERVSSSQQEASDLGMPGTPAAIFNGELLAGDSLPPITYWIWEALVKLELLTDRQYDAPPDMMLAEGASYQAVVTMASGDTFTIELFADKAPLAVNNFVFLAREGWFDGVTFHRVLPGFVAQTGDPTGTGFGSPGYIFDNEVDASLSHAEAGMVAMANSGPDTNGSQWYITLGDVSQLDGGYTIFGQVIAGMDVVQALTPRDPSVDPEAPAGDVIETITIEELP